MFLKTRSKGIYIFIIIVCLIFVGWLWYKFVPYIKDLKAVRFHNFSYFTEEVIEYKKRKAIGGIAVSYKYSQPIIRDANGNQITFNVNDTELNKTYTFIYLKHTKNLAPS